VGLTLAKISDGFADCQSGSLSVPSKRGARSARTASAMRATSCGEGGLGSGKAFPKAAPPLIRINAPAQRSQVHAHSCIPSARNCIAAPCGRWVGVSKWGVLWGKAFPDQVPLLPGSGAHGRSSPGGPCTFGCTLNDPLWQSAKPH